LHPKFYKLEFLLDIKSAPNYTEILKLTGITTTTFASNNKSCRIPTPSPLNEVVGFQH
jgi:hypothetical protein